MTAMKTSMTAAGLFAGVLAFGSAASPANAQYYYGGYCPPPVYAAPPVYCAPPVYVAPAPVYYPRYYGYYGGGYYRPYYRAYPAPYYRGGRGFAFGFGYRH
jgi:hypothetical protein